MTTTRRRRRRPLLRARRRGDDGFVLIMVIAVSVVLTILAGVAVGYAESSMTQARKDQDYYAALAAADAGVDDYLSRLNRNDNYWSAPDTSNPAFSGFTPVPGDASGAEFTYSVDASNMLSNGTLQVTSTGKVGDKERTTVSLLRRRNSLDYVYMSDYETFYPRLPGAYQDVQTALDLCGERYYYQAGPVGGKSDGQHRNDKYCQFRQTATGGINGGGEIVNGAMHSNDVLFFNASPTINGKVTSSCEGSTSPNGCPESSIVLNHTVGSNSSGAGSVSAGTVPSYQTKDVEPYTAGSSVFRQGQPEYAPPLDFPKTNGALLDTAIAGGCVFTGPTRVKFVVQGGVGYAQVTSPDTRKILGPCGGKGGQSIAAAWTGSAQPNVMIPTAPGSTFNGVIYIQDVPADSSDPNAPSGSSANTCRKAGKPYLAAGNSTQDMFPSAQDTSPTSPDTWFDCQRGAVFVEGKLKGQVTLGAMDNVFITQSIVYNSSDSSGNPPSTCSTLSACDVLGLIANNYVSMYHPVYKFASNQNTCGSSCYQEVSDYDGALNPVVDAAIMALNKCWTTQNPNGGKEGGFFHLRGSLANKYRCAMGNGSKGYGKDYTYDPRLKVLAPPYMLQLFSAAWQVQQTGEKTR